jgi:NADH:ubiquinone reductase (H+-translocating)
MTDETAHLHRGTRRRGSVAAGGARSAGGDRQGNRTMQRILILGAGFAGLWSAIGAARRRDELGIDSTQLEILVIDQNPWHSIRVRNYESELEQTRVPLREVLDPVGVKHLAGRVRDIDVTKHEVAYAAGDQTQGVTCDRVVIALGSRLVRPAIPGLDQYAFDVDTYAAGCRLNQHVADLPRSPSRPGQYTAVVVGGGLTGIEAATELVSKLKQARQSAPVSDHTPPLRVILADHKPWIGSDMGESARPVIAEALQALGVETWVGVSLAAVEADAAVLADGERIPASTVVWCAGMRANPLTERIPVTRDPLGRVPVDPFMRVIGVPATFAAGDAAWLAIDGKHLSVMSCQHGRPMGRFAGHNVVCDLMGQPMLPLSIDWYTTILDLGAWGAVYTEGWDRQVVAKGAAAKRTKDIINRERIYPPRSGNRREILDASVPVVQKPPPVFGGAPAE